MVIALIHVQMVSAPAMNAAFAEGWPEAAVVNVLDEALFTASSRGPAHMQDRFLAIARYAAAAPVEGIVFTCSAFGRAIEVVQRALAPLPVLKPNEAMIEDAARSGARVGLLATFAPTLAAMSREFPPGVIAGQALAAGAFGALNAGDAATHDRLVVSAALRDLAGCDLIALAQSSMARTAHAVAEATGKHVLTTPGSAVAKLRRLLAG